MAQLNTIIEGGFNPEQIEDAPSFENAPDGVYIAEVEKADITTPDGATVLEVQYRLMQNEAGVDFNQCSWEKFALAHPDANRQKWGQIFFKRLVDNAIAPNHPIQDTDELIGKYVKITLKTKPSKDGKMFQNVSDVKPANAAAAPVQAVAAPVAATPPAAAKKLPW